MKSSGPLDLRDRAQALLASLNLRSTGKWIVLAGLVGAAAGCGAVVFIFACQLVLHFALGVVAGYWPAEASGEHSWFAAGSGVVHLPLLLVTLAAGGFLSGLLVRIAAPDAAGHGTDGVIDAYHRKGGRIRARIPFVKLLASALTLGTGGSGGREGPITQIGGGLGSLIASLFRLNATDRRILLAAGMGAGVGAVFRAPLAGAFFAAEILYREADIEAEVIIPAAIASTTAYTVHSMTLPEALRFSPLFGVSSAGSIGGFHELLFLGFLALVLNLAGFLFVRCFRGIEGISRALRIPSCLRSAVGALLAGVLAVVFFLSSGRDARTLALLGTGYDVLQRAIADPASLGAGLLLALAAGKILTTALTVGSGGSAGLFGPAVFLGGSIGGAVGLVLQDLVPGSVHDPRAWTILGMGGFFAGVGRAPFCAVIMVSELTGDYHLLLPALWISSLCFLLNRRWTLYASQVPRRMDSPAHRGDFIVDVLRGCRVREAFDATRRIEVVPEGMRLEDILVLVSRTTQSSYPVLDAEGRLLGLFTDKDVRAHFRDPTLWSLVVAGDIADVEFASVSPDDDLDTALSRFAERDVEELPVLDPANPRSGRPLGFLRRRDVIALYTKRLASTIAERAEIVPPTGK